MPSPKTTLFSFTYERKRQWGFYGGKRWRSHRHTAHTFCGPLRRVFSSSEGRPAAGTSSQHIRLRATPRDIPREEILEGETAIRESPASDFSTGGDLARGRVLSFLTLTSLCLSSTKTLFGILFKRAKSVKYDCLRRRVFGLDG